MYILPSRVRNNGAIRSKTRGTTRPQTNTTPQTNITPIPIPRHKPIPHYKPTPHHKPIPLLSAHSEDPRVQGQCVTKQFIYSNALLTRYDQSQQVTWENNIALKSERPGFWILSLSKPQFQLP